MHARDDRAQEPPAPAGVAAPLVAPGRRRSGAGRTSVSRIGGHPTIAPTSEPALARGVVDVAGRLGFDALALAWTVRGLVSLRMLRGRAADAAIREATEPVPSELAAPLVAYLAGEAVDPTALPVELHGTPFQRRVWHALRAIPRGQVRSYADVARAVGSPRATRAVGAANAANPVPIVVPCHRVVRAGGGLGGYSGGGPGRKGSLLALEGVSVRAGRVDPGQLPLRGP